MLAGRLLLALLGIELAVGTPLAQREVQEPGGGNANRGDKTSSTSRGTPSVLSGDVPVWAAVLGLPIAAWAGRRTLTTKVARLEQDLQAARSGTTIAADADIANMPLDQLRREVQTLRDEIARAKRTPARMDHIIFELDGHRMRLHQWEEYLRGVGKCEGDRLLVMRFVPRDQRKQIFKELDTEWVDYPHGRTPPETVEHVRGECERDLLEWYRQGQPPTGPAEPRVWKDAKEAAFEDYRVRNPTRYRHAKDEEWRRREQQQQQQRKTVDGNENSHPLKMDLAMASTKQFIDDLPQMAQRVSEDVKTKTPGFVNAAAAGLASSTQIMAFQNMKWRPKVGFVP